MVFERAIIHYPEDENALEKLYKEIADFRLETVLQLMSSLNFSRDAINELLDEISAHKSTNK